LIPRIVSITDGLNLVQVNRSTTGHLKVQLEEVSEPELVSASVDDRPVSKIEVLCIDPRAPRHEVNLRLPRLPKGSHVLQLRIGKRRLLPAAIQVE